MFAFVYLAVIHHFCNLSQSRRIRGIISPSVGGALISKRIQVFRYQMHRRIESAKLKKKFKQHISYPMQKMQPGPDRRNQSAENEEIR